MTDQAKLQQLFNAALKSRPEDYTRKPAAYRAVPTPSPVAMSAAVARINHHVPVVERIPIR